jgi:hypothetical protein
MPRSWYDVCIVWDLLNEDSMPVREPKRVAAQVLIALERGSVVAHELNLGIFERWGWVGDNKTGLGVFSWEQTLRVDDIWAAITAAREALAALGAPAETYFRVAGRSRRFVRTYLLHPPTEVDEWSDLDQIERLAALPEDWVRK